MAFWPGEAAPKLEDPPQPGVLGTAPGLAGRTEWGCGVEGMGRVLPGGWDLEFTSDWLWHPLKTLSGKTVTKCHDFHSSWRSAEFGDSQHEFLSFSGSSKATATCLCTAPPSAEALRVRSVRTSGHNLVWKGMRYEGLKLERGVKGKDGEGGWQSKDSYKLKDEETHSSKSQRKTDGWNPNWT